MLAPSTLFDLGNQAYAAFGLPTAIRNAHARPGVISGLQLVDTAANVIGVESLTSAIVRMGVKLALRSGHAAEQGATRMVEAMRARVPRDTGALYNGIGWSQSDGRIVVRADSAAFEGDTDHSRFVEFGTRPGIRGGHTGVADAQFFTAQAGATLGPGRPRKYQPGARDRRQYRTHPGNAAQPFFWPSVREELPALRASMNRLSVDIGQEEGF